MFFLEEQRGVTGRTGIHEGVNAKLRDCMNELKHLHSFQNNFIKFSIAKRESNVANGKFVVNDNKCSQSIK